MSRVQINTYVCKLRLLQYGLVDEAGVIDSMGTGKTDKKKLKDEGSDSEDEDEEDLIERRNTYVKKCIREAQASGRLKSLMAGAKNPIATEQRRTVVKEFFKDIVSFKKCTNCSGYVDAQISDNLQRGGTAADIGQVFRQDTGETDTRRSSASLWPRSPDSRCCKLVSRLPIL